jgi:hypothetical protein
MPYLDARFKKVIVVSGIHNNAEWLQTTVVNQITELRKTISPQDFKSISPLLQVMMQVCT